MSARDAGAGSGPVRLVTDSTAYLPAELVRVHSLVVVPLLVMFPDGARTEGSVGALPGLGVPEGTASGAEVARALAGRRAVTTSRPSPEAFAAAYAGLAEAGAREVVSVHLSAEMSGTVDAARTAARSAPLPVHVVDSRTLGMGLGYAVVSAAEAVEAGANGRAAARAARERALATTTYFYVDTLEHLRRGGRIGAAQALVGSALAVKPLLQLVDGRTAPLEKVRTSARALARLEALVVERAGQRVVDLAVHHLAAPERAGALAAALRSRVPGLRELYVEEVGAVVGAHVGPGMLAVVVAPRPGG